MLREDNNSNSYKIDYFRLLDGFNVFYSVQNRDYNYVESESGGDDVRDGVFKHAQVSLVFELKRLKVQSEDDV